MRRSSGNPGEVLSAKSLVLVRISCGDPGEALSRRSLHDLVQVLATLKDPCIKTLKMLCISGACVGVLLGCA